ncbi:MAG: DEAD/DEAH box helicase family protein [Leptospiraceae bacterium]|nr:DEAD/DEAH box helicase family protein [Leptospiraceae bacterium]
MSKNPVLNNPYLEPTLHYGTNKEGELDYDDIQKGRRLFVPDLNVVPTEQMKQKNLLGTNQLYATFEKHLINLVRKEVGDWRKDGYKNVTRVTKELLLFWFENPERHDMKKLFFAQREAIETAIWLNEVAEKSNPGQNILNILHTEQKSVGTEAHQQLPRIAFKMATGSGKTVVMACLILYHFLNRQEYKADTRFSDYFLLVAPGVTIRDRLGVLFVDKNEKSKNHRKDYYAVRDLVPSRLESSLGNLNAKLIITNYHNFEPRTLQGNKRSPLDGKIIGHDENGKPIKQEAKEDFPLVIKRLLGKFKKSSRLLILNDEAHHCYLPKEKGKTTDNEDKDENERAAVWFTGISELTKHYKVSSVYDLSATPYYLSGSGYIPYSLFGWVVSDFNLTEAIESGLVKIPFLPVSDNTHELTMPVLRNLYEHVKNDLPKKGQRTQKKEAKEEGKKLSELPPQIPPLVKGALDQFYNHYKDYCDNIRYKGEAEVDLFSKPPVFIAVCNNTSVSKEVYKFIAGYEYVDESGEIHTIKGHYDLFSNFDQLGRVKKKSPTLLIDSEALEDGGQISDDFKKIFSSEIEEFKKEYARQHGHGSAESISDAELLREVVNTVGNPGRLGGHILCVVSVSMLTEGWDANTVTHVMGLRAFGSQLLCEQVAGRALRRMNYHLQSYDKEGNPTEDGRKIHTYKFPPEYAHIIGIPFKLYQSGTSSPVDPKEFTNIFPIPERQAELEITFPNIVGYRAEFLEEKLTFDFSKVPNYEIDGTKFPIETMMATGFSEAEEKLEVKTVLEKREQEMIYLLTKELIKYKFSDVDGKPYFQKFQSLKTIVEYWYENKIALLNIRDVKFKKLLYFHDPKVLSEHISKGINPHLNTEEFIKPVFNHYNRFGSTKHVSGITSKGVYETTKSHINYVVEDSDWEAICAKTLEEIPEVVSYVKNQFLGFTIPYIKAGKEHLYYPDFIAKIKTKDGSFKNLIIEVTGMDRGGDKEEKKWYVNNRWLPSVNSVREQFDYPEWFFIEISKDIRDIKNQLLDKIAGMI